MHLQLAQLHTQFLACVALQQPARDALIRHALSVRSRSPVLRHKSTDAHVDVVALGEEPSIAAGDWREVEYQVLRPVSSGQRRPAEPRREPSPPTQTHAHATQARRPFPPTRLSIQSPSRRVSPNHHAAHRAPPPAAASVRSIHPRRSKPQPAASQLAPSPSRNLDLDPRRQLPHRHDALNLLQLRARG